MVQWPSAHPHLAQYGMVRRYGTKCDYNKIYVNNRRFRNSQNGFGEIMLTSENGFKPCMEYRTHYGWCFAHNGMIYEKSDHNTVLAIRRLTQCRMPKGCTNPNIPPVFDAAHRLLSKKFISKHWVMMRQKFRENIPIVTFHDDKVASAMALMFKVHDKRLLRVDGVKEVHDNGMIAMLHWTLSVLWKLKTNEIAKPDKLPRAIVDLGVVASLECAEWVEYCKHLLDGKRIVVDNCCYIFCGSPDPLVVIRLLLELWHNPNNYRMMFVVFSDDGVLGCNVGGVWRCFNSDIETCDASHVDLLFEFLFDIFDAPERVRADFRHQMTIDARVESMDKKMRVFFKCMGLHLQSGSTITTLCNCIAQLVIFFSLVIGKQNDDNDIIKCIRQCGYVVVLTHCEIIEDLQFLKMSPTQDVKGNYHATLNLGVVLRASGTCKGDLPKSGAGRNFHIDAARFQSNLMTGMLCNVIHPALESLSPYPIPRGDYVKMRTALEVARTMVDSLRYMKVVEAVTYDTSIYNRYRLTSLEIVELESMMKGSTFGTVAYCTAVSKILEKDYGLTCPLI